MEKKRYEVWTQKGSPTCRKLHATFHTLAGVHEYLSSKVMPPQDWDVIDRETNRYVNYKTFKPADASAQTLYETYIDTGTPLIDVATSCEYEWLIVEIEEWSEEEGIKLSISAREAADKIIEHARVELFRLAEEWVEENDLECFRDRLLCGMEDQYQYLAELAASDSRDVLGSIEEQIEQDRPFEYGDYMRDRSR